MNEQLQGKLVEILSQIQTAVKAAGDFALEQLPDVVQQFVLYGRATYTFHISLAVILIIVSLFLIIKKAIYGKQIGQDYLNSWSENRQGAMVTGIAIGFIGMFTLFANIGNFFMVWFAPKIWLIKEIAILLK